MLFDVEPNSKKAATIEHLQAKANGGGNALGNLVLTHPGCNRMLGTKPIEKKRAIRAKLIANRAKVAAKAQAGTSGHPLPATAATTGPKKPLPAGTDRQAAKPSPPSRSEADWRKLALLGGGIALASAGFSVGVVVGLLLS